MSGVTGALASEAVLKAIDTAILVMLGDKVTAAQQRAIRNTIVAVHEGRMSAEDAYEVLRFKDGDALDQALRGAPAAEQK
jgi:hypothetical protein